MILALLLAPHAAPLEGDAVAALNVRPMQTPGPNICMWSDQLQTVKAVPTLFLLGCKKCSTTSFSTVLRDAGIKMMASAAGEGPGEKEWHFFDACLCAQTEGCRYTAGGPPTAANAAARQFETCRDVVVNSDARNLFVRANDYPCEEPGTVCDATPDNMRLDGLHQVLADLYSGQVSRMNFVMLLRDPMVRMQSDFYYAIETGRVTHADVGSFRSYVRNLETLIPENYTAVQEQQTALSGNPAVDYWFRSLYALQLRPWLEDAPYQSSQFVVLPMHWAMGHTLEAVELLGTQFPTLTLNLSAVPAETPHDLGHSYVPALEDDLEQDTRDRLNTRHFHPDMDVLVTLLETSMSRGLRLGGFDHSLSVKQHLNRFW
jgi:hypothetical protein